MAGDTDDWERIAHDYVRLQDDPAGAYMRDRVRTELWSMLGDIHGRRVLDIGCGDGWLAAELIAAGASVTGVDGSSTLLGEARRACPEARLLEQDLLHGLPRLDREFDLAVCSMVLMDLPDLDPLLGDLSRVVKAGGRFLFAILHPCFFNYTWTTDPATGRAARLIGDYLNERVWRIASFGGHNHYHRPLSAYVRSLRRHGFLTADLREPLHRKGGEEIDDGAALPVLLFGEAVLWGRAAEAAAFTAH